MLIPSQINRLKRQMNDLQNEIYRAEKYNRTERAERLKVTFSYLQDAVGGLKQYQQM